MGKYNIFKIDLTFQNIITALILGSFFVSTVIISLLVYQDYPYVMDEYGYLTQAKIFASGNLTMPIQNLPEELKDYFFVLHDGQIFSKYPPLFSSVLAIGVLFRTPFLINPLICTFFLICLYQIIVKHVSKNVANCTLGMVASNPYFLGYASSYFSQPLSLLLTTLAFLIASLVDKNSNKSLYLLGAIFGFHIANRPLDAFCSTISCLYLVSKKKNLVSILKPLPMMVCFIICFCSYNWGISGNFSISTYRIIDSEFKVYYSNAESFFDGIRLFTLEYLDSFFKNLLPLITVQYFIYMAGVLPLIAFIGGITQLKKPLTVALIFHLFLLIALYNFHNSQGWPQYGARYYYPSWIGLGILTSFGLIFLRDRINFIQNRKFNLLTPYVLAFSIIILQITVQISYLKEYESRFDFVIQVQNEITKNCGDNSIVILDRKSWQKNVNTKFLNPIDFSRNSNGNNSHVFVLNKSSLSDATIAYPDRAVCHFNFPIFDLGF